MPANMRSPVVFMIFNRPEHTRRVFAEIAKARPPKLFVIADGPRADRLDEPERCAATRAVIDEVGWDCEVHRDFSDTNLGCGHRFYSGMNWSFEQVSEAIYLEDDTLPHENFFRFAEELLEKYRDDERVMHISGSSLQFGRRRGPHSYYFSRYGHFWGYATWRRAFQHYDFEMKFWPSLRNTSWLKDLLGDDVSSDWWRTMFDKAHSGDPTVYSARWIFALWRQNGLAITPNANLVTNIGFGADAVHTTAVDSPLANIPLGEMSFPLSHPSCFVRDVDADRFAFEVACKAPEPWTPRAWLRDRIPAAIRRRMPLAYLRSVLSSGQHGR